MGDLTGTITAAALHSHFDTERANLNTEATAGPFSYTMGFYRRSVASGADISLRSLIWTQRDDAEVLVLGADGHGGSGTQVTTVTLEAVGITADDGTVTADTSPLLEETVSVAVTSTTTSWFHARQNYEDTTATRHWLLSGITYRLSAAVDTGTMDAVQAWVLLGALQRRSR